MTEGSVRPSGKPDRLPVEPVRIRIVSDAIRRESIAVPGRRLKVRRRPTDANVRLNMRHLLDMIDDHLEVPLPVHRLAVFGANENIRTHARSPASNECKNRVVEPPTR